MSGFFFFYKKLFKTLYYIGMDTQAFRRSLHHSDRYNRRGFDSPTKRAQALEEAYQSDLISSIRDNGFTYTKGRLNIKLAQAFGFCWGVERLSLIHI